MLKVCAAMFFFVLGMPVAIGDTEISVLQEGTVRVPSVVGKVIEAVVAEGVADLLRSGDPDSLRVEHVSGRLFITRLKQDPAELIVIDRKGRSFRLVLEQGEIATMKVHLGKADRPLGAARGQEVFDLIRGMVKGIFLPGVVVSDSCARVYEDENMSIDLKTQYERPALIGYKALLHNKRDVPLAVPLENIDLSNLLAVSSAEDILQPAGTPGSSTEVWLVVAR